MLNVSVVVPVYNAAKYVREAVESACDQAETVEVLLIEDGSTDSSLLECRRLDRKFRKVRLLQHANGGNNGPGASRNLGIQEAAADWIAFLDADDYMLPGRFRKTNHVIEEHVDCEGVYEAVGRVFETKELELAWRESGQPWLTTVQREVTPDELFVTQSPVGRSGYACTDGWTVRKEIFDKTGWFNTKLELHQDTDMFMKFAAVGRMYPGEITKPVAMRRVHESNRISRRRSLRHQYHYRINMWLSILSWARKNRLRREYQVLIKRAVKCVERNVDPNLREFSRKRQLIARYLAIVAKHPPICVEKQFYKGMLDSFCR